MKESDSCDNMNPFPDDNHNFDYCVRFITTLAQALEKYASHSHEINKILYRVIKALGLNGEILAIPNIMMIVLWQDDIHHQTIHVAITRETNFDMARLGKVRDLIVEVERGRTGPSDGLIRLNEIDRAPAMYGNRQKSFAYFLAGAGFGVLLGISWLDVFIGGVLGVIAFGVELLASRNPRIENGSELLISGLVALIAGIIGVIFPGMHPLAVTVCALTIYIPGFGLTIAPREIIVGDTLSGIIYFMNALVISLKLLLGTVLGLGVAHYIVPVVMTIPVVGIDPIFVWIFIPLLVISNGILFGVTRNNLWLVIVCGMLVWAGLKAGDTLGYWQGSFLGAVILTFYARIAAQLFKIPLATILLPVVLILVPGYQFIQALYMINAVDYISGISARFQVFVIIIAIICGVFVGDILGSLNQKKTY